MSSRPSSVADGLRIATKADTGRLCSIPARPSGSQLRWGLLVGTLQRDVSP
jgi:hypothetical protein